MGCGADLIALIFFSGLRDHREETLHSELGSTEGVAKAGVGRMDVPRGVSSTPPWTRRLVSTRRFLDGDGVRMIEVSISKESYRRRFPRFSTPSRSMWEADSGHDGTVSNKDRTEEQSDYRNMEMGVFWEFDEWKVWKEVVVYMD
jgi:hypothetical protein